MDKNKSIEEYENDYWQQHDFPTGLVKKVYDLRKKRLKDLSISDLRVAISQDVGRKYTIPLALAVLKKELLIEADFYPGDLLECILNIDNKFWSSNLEMKENLNHLLINAQIVIKEFNGINEDIKDKLLTLVLKVNPS